MYSRHMAMDNVFCDVSFVLEVNIVGLFCKHLFSDFFVAFHGHFDKVLGVTVYSENFRQNSTSKVGCMLIFILISTN